MILIAEDNEMNQQLLIQQLKFLGVTEVEVVNDGLAALEWLAHKQCDLLLVDCQMPRMNGYDLAKAIRKNEIRSGLHLPIIALSACAMESDQELCVFAGMDHHLSKPVQLAELRQVLSTWMKP